MTERILVIDDDAPFRDMLCEALAGKGYEIGASGSAEDGLKRVAAEHFDIILLDVNLPGMSGFDALPLLRKETPTSDVIVMTGYSSKESGLTAIRHGAYDYFSKPFSLGEMEVVIRRALEKRRLQSQVQSLRESLRQDSPLGRIIGDSEAMRRVKAMIERIAGLETNVLIMGETGTGKELISDTIHALSQRAAGPFVKINCAAIPETLLESELFGHEKGAFTGAAATKLGKFELATEGSILLDELGEMPLHLQPKLLRVLEQREIERLGGVKPIDLNVRIIAATNQELEKLVQDKKFRQDLFYRLNVARITLPPLRERKEDIPLLAEHFLKSINRRLGTDIARVSASAMELLLRYDWPGNVRQFSNILERAAIFCQGQVITPSEIDMGMHQDYPSAAPATAAESDLPVNLKQFLQDTERNLILRALSQTSGVQTEAARLLGITPKNLWNKIRKHEIDFS